MTESTFDVTFISCARDEEAPPHNNGMPDCKMNFTVRQPEMTKLTLHKTFSYAHEVFV